MDEGRSFPTHPAGGWAWEKPLAVPPGADGGRAVFATIATPASAPQARVFCRSVRNNGHPDATLAVLVLGGNGLRLEDLFDLVIRPEQLSVTGLADLRWRYPGGELAIGLKPWFIRHLLDVVPGVPLLWGDPDVEVFSRLREVEAALDGGANLVVVPRLLRPVADRAQERATLGSGLLDAGFLAVAPTPAARAFVAWWCDRARMGTIAQDARAASCDGRWLDLAPSICDGVAVLRHPGYGFAA